MKYLTFLVFLSFILTVPVVQSQSQTKDVLTKIEEAMSAAPLSISANATILDYPAEAGGKKIVLRKGTNGWTCRPDNPHIPGYNPMCVDTQVFELLSAAAEKKNQI